MKQDNGKYMEFYQKSDRFLYGLTGLGKVKSRNRLLWWAVILSQILLIGVLVYFTGGTPNTISHLMYIPIIISVFIYGVKGGIVTSLISGLVLGPYMPVKVTQATNQDAFQWMFRIFIFFIIVFVVGQLTNYIRKLNDQEKKKAYEDTLTGRPNLNKFKLDLCNMMNGERQSITSIFLFEFVNMETVNRYVSYEIGHKSMLMLMDEAMNYFKGGTIYSVATDKFIVLLSEIDCKDANDAAKAFSQRLKKPLYINELPVVVILRGGQICSPLNNDRVDHVVEQLEKALDQASKSHNDIMVYDEKIAQDNRDYYNTLISLYRAVQNDNFTLVYQPKISLSDHEMVGVEALLRWNDSTYSNIPIAYVIKLAEDAEFIGQITKWVIEHAILQLKIWKEEGLHTKVAINLSPRDLSDTSLLEYTKDSLDRYGIEPSLLEFELTERTIIDDESKLFNVLNEIKKIGIKISLDDYGTGHNSLKYLSRLLFHFEYIKIDKLFMDDIKSYRILLAAVINAAHSFDTKVIAEGVETKEQLDIINEIGCDIVQGYYFSKPLPPKKLKEFVDKL